MRDLKQNKLTNIAKLVAEKKQVIARGERDREVREIGEGDKRYKLPVGK